LTSGLAETVILGMKVEVVIPGMKVGVVILGMKEGTVIPSGSEMTANRDTERNVTPRSPKLRKKGWKLSGLRSATEMRFVQP
jgi:hypothetical protein